jgi:acetyl-CoA carboxylase carboxyl transferase subunit alpha
MATLDFEKPILDLEHKIEDLRQMGSKRLTLEPEIKRLEAKLDKLKNDVYKHMTTWQRVQIARHPKRPYSLDYIRMMTEDFLELHGDRFFADDNAMVGGFAAIEGRKVMVIGHQKGRDVKENVQRNFGCAHPEGYRKAMRLMRLAAKFKVPVVCLIDTPGAYPGVGAEERGQAQAIAENLRDMAGLRTPVVAVIIGEGGSGGALGIGVADQVFILQHAYYSVISPEGCASILWRSSLKAPQAADALKLHGEDLLKHNIVNDIIPEPLGGAHRDPQEAALNLKSALVKYLKKVSALTIEEVLDARYKKYRDIGNFIENPPAHDS